MIIKMENKWIINHSYRLVAQIEAYIQQNTCHPQNAKLEATLVNPARQHDD